jgi:hypothetical protein
VSLKEHFSFDNILPQLTIGENLGSQSLSLKGRRQTNCSQGFGMVKRTEEAAHCYAKANNETRMLSPKNGGWNAALVIMARMLERQLQPQMITAAESVAPGAPSSGQFATGSLNPTSCSTGAAAAQAQGGHGAYWPHC